MQLSTLTFFAFCIITATIYYLLPRPFKKYWLLAASYYFYDSWSTQFLIAILVFTLTNYIVGRLLGSASRHKRLILILGIGFNVFFVLMLKYADFFLPALHELLSQIGLSTPVLAILFPIGLSYMVLQAVGYLVDIHRNEIAPETDLATFAIFIAYFPKVISGPIESARHFLPQIKEPAPLTGAEIGQGLFLFLEGLFRKRVLADVLWSMNPYQNILADQNTGKLTILIWVLASLCAMYMDFSGYSNMARGLSKFFGIELSVNFRAPQFATTMTDFWSRWHISFTNWAREYIFYPLSRSIIRRTRSARHPLNYVIPITGTMLFSALWHDIAIEHAVWAGFIGLILILEQYRRVNQSVKNPAQKRWWQNIPVAVYLLPFHVMFLNSFTDTVTLWRTFVLTAPFTLNPNALRALILVVPALLIEWSHYRTNDEFWLLKKPIIGPLIAAAALVALILVSYTDLITAAFIYQDF